MGGFSHSEKEIREVGRHVIGIGDSRYPALLAEAGRPPDELYVIGDPAALAVPMVAVIGARRATPYGLACARRFAALAVQTGFCVVSGGARGVDAEAHRAALEAGGRTVAVLGGGIDRPYPHEHAPLFERIAGSGGAVASEQPWDAPPLPWMFRARNRIVAGLACAVVVCEAGLPSGTLSTCDDALGAGREVLAVPGPITSAASAGPNRLLLCGASPVVDDESLMAVLESAAVRAAR